MPEYAVTFAVTADTLDAARAEVEKWQTSGGARVTLIIGPPETWVPEPPAPEVGLPPEPELVGRADVDTRGQNLSDDEPTP